MGDLGQLERVNTVEYLGVIFDENFNWHAHIRTLVTKFSRAAGIISKLRHYVDVRVLLTVYYSLIYSHLSYAILYVGELRDCQT